MDYLKKFKRTITDGAAKVGYKQYMTFLELAPENGREEEEEYFLLHPLREGVPTGEEVKGCIKTFNRLTEDGKGEVGYKEFRTFAELQREADTEENEQCFWMYPLYSTGIEATLYNDLKAKIAAAETHASETD